MCNLKLNLVIFCEKANVLQQYQSHQEFDVDYIGQKIEQSKHLNIGKDGQNCKIKTKKKRNFIEDLPMDLHIDDSIVDGQLEDGEEHKQPEPVLLPSISDAKQLISGYQQKGKLFSWQKQCEISKNTQDEKKSNFKPESACQPLHILNTSKTLDNGIEKQIATSTAPAKNSYDHPQS